MCIVNARLASRVASQVREAREDAILKSMKALIATQHKMTKAAKTAAKDEAKEEKEGDGKPKKAGFFDKMRARFQVARARPPVAPARSLPRCPPGS